MEADKSGHERLSGKQLLLPLPRLLQSPPHKGRLESSNDWQLDPTELASKFTPRTKALVLNTPNNPLGKVPGSIQRPLQAEFPSLCEVGGLYALNSEGPTLPEV